MRTRQASVLAVFVIGTATFAMILRPRPSVLADPPNHGTATQGAADKQAASVAPEEALRRLRDGNQRFVQQAATRLHQDADRRQEVAAGQHPFAIVLGCADSRVPPEVIFDQGLGDLFVIRVAGEVASAEVIGSIEYAVDHLGCRAILVLGHKRCGAVEAALAPDAGASEENLNQLIHQIAPALRTIDRSAPDALDAAVIANAESVAQTLIMRSKLLQVEAQKGVIVVEPARYDLDSGTVEFLKPITTPAGNR